MPPKYTKEEANKIADKLCNKNNLIRLEDCDNIYNKFKAMTEEGYLVYPSIKNLRRNRQPLKFFKDNPDTIYNIKLWIKISNKNIELISKIYKGSNKKLKWLCKNNKCEKYNKEFIKTWHTVQQNHVCPNCGIIKGKEVRKIPPKAKSLLDIYFELCNKYWDYKRNNKTPDQYYSKSNQSVYWKCNECGYQIPNKLNINNVVKHGVSCPKCSDGISYPEKLMFNILLQLNIKFKKGKIFNWSKNIKYKNEKLCGNKIYDFWIESRNCIIETHGNHHYKNMKWKNKKTKSLKEEQENDNLKERLAKKNGIKHYIIIDCYKSELEYIKNNILNSTLNNLFDLNQIDWEEVHKNSCKSKVKEICNLWSMGIKNINELNKITGLGNWAIRNYLKKGSEINWCDYNSKKEMEKNGRQTGKRNRKPIIQLNIKGEYINKYKSMTEAAKLLNLNISNISKVCNKQRASTMGFIFMFKKNYIK
jgi:DNA-directed RNA polymerase subunit RPC12/RpoP/predicted RNA-binding Zn-ribbon protein involved in translation (DUF1610 family)